MFFQLVLLQRLVINFSFKSLLPLFAADVHALCFIDRRQLVCQKLLIFPINKFTGHISFPLFHLLQYRRCHFSHHRLILPCCLSALSCIVEDLIQDHLSMFSSSLSFSSECNLYVQKHTFFTLKQLLF